LYQCVSRVEAVHGPVEVRFRRLHEQVEVRRHLAIRVTAPAVFTRDVVEEAEMDFSVVDVVEDRAVAVSIRPDVIDRVRYWMRAGRPTHRR